MKHMPAARKLTESEIAAALEQLPGWSVDSGRLCREFSFPDFVHAFGFMTKLALFSERKNHHPDWSNSYNSVRISLVTHSLSGLSTLDFDWAHAATKMYTS